MPISKDKQWIAQYPQLRGSLKNLEAYVKTGRIHRDKYYHWDSWSEFRGTLRMTLEEAVAWVSEQRKKLRETMLTVEFKQVYFDENRLYNVHTGETIPFSALQD